MTDEELRELEERVQAIKDLITTNGWVYATDRVRAQIFVKQRQLLLGKAKDFEEYREWVSYTDGLSFLLNLPDAVQAELDFELERREEEKSYE